MTRPTAPPPQRESDPVTEARRHRIPSPTLEPEDERVQLVSWDAPLVPDNR